jgi:hypothetical protein
MINGAPFGAEAPTYGGWVGRRRLYFLLMGTCLTLFLLAGLVVRHFSTPLAVVMTAVALAIPPIAVIVANAGREH